jgi:hypothetical protein
MLRMMTTPQSTPPPAAPPTATTGTPTAAAPMTPLALFDRRPALPPAPTDARWTWTKAKLKAVYLDALTDLDKTAIADAVAVDRKTLFRWRQHADYRRYLAALVFEDGLADRVERVKSRKSLAQKLGEKLAQKLDGNDALFGEKLAPLLKAHKDMLDGLQDDADDLAQKAGDAAGPETPRRAFDLVDRVNGIADPVERETVKRHLLGMLRDYLEGRAGPETPIDAEALPPETPGRAAAAPALGMSGMLDQDGPRSPETPGAAMQGPTVADLIEAAPDALGMTADDLDAGAQNPGEV